MPQTKRKFYPKRKSYKSKDKFGSINRAPLVKAQPFPRVLHTQCKYGTSTGMMNNAFQTATSTTFRLNSIWDPDLTGAGTTVVGHAQLAALYNRYLVTNAKISVRFYDPSADGVRCGVRLRTAGLGTTSGQTATYLAGQPMTYQSGLANSGKQIKTFNLNVKPWTLMGLSKLEYFANTTAYSAPITGNPVNDICVMDIWSVDMNLVETKILYTVKIVYDVQLYDRKPLVAS